MREILFRGKRTDNGEWIEGYYAKQSNHACFAHELKYTHFIFKDICLDFNLGGLQEFEVIPETVGQYTGLTDKNGKKVFEGDILESPIGRKAVVSFGTYKPFSTKDSDDFECWKLTLIANNEGETKLECGLGKHCMEYMKVIGNIHDNPELLKGDKGNG